MVSLSTLKDYSRKKTKVQRVGRGVGSKRGKTSCRGQKGDGARQGYCRRFGYEGGQVPLYMKLPIRGFTRGRFAKPFFAISLTRIEQLFQNEAVITIDSLREKGLFPKRGSLKLKILAGKEITKKISIEAHQFSEGAKEQLEKSNISYTVIS